MICTHPGCTVTIDTSRPRKGTLCRAHQAAATARSPERREKARQQMKALASDKATWKPRQERAAAAHRAKIASDPAYRESMTRLGRRMGRAALGTFIRHVPLEYRGLYLSLKNTLPAAERLEIVRQQMEVDARRYAATGQLPVTGSQQ